MLPGLLALGSTVGGQAINKALGLGGGGGGSMPAPISSTNRMGDVTFGPKYIGDAAVKEAPAIMDAANREWTKFIPWIVGGIVAVFAALVFALVSRTKK